MADWNTVSEFERKVAEFFGAPYGVSVDSCTHSLELCLRYKKSKYIISPRRTYISVPMLAEKLGIDRLWNDLEWNDYYYLQGDDNIIDAAVLWRKDSYIEGSLMCLSFQFQKHLNLNRGGMILCDDARAAEELTKMRYDGRIPGYPWRDQNIASFGFHYYMSPEIAEMGLQKLPDAIATEPRKWTCDDYPDVSQFKVFKQ